MIIYGLLLVFQILSFRRFFFFLISFRRLSIYVSLIFHFWKLHHGHGMAFQSSLGPDYNQLFGSKLMHRIVCHLSFESIWLHCCTQVKSNNIKTKKTISTRYSQAPFFPYDKSIPSSPMVVESIFLQWLKIQNKLNN